MVWRLLCQGEVMGLFAACPVIQYRLASDVRGEMRPER
jgi:hypothetical protein